MRKPAPGMIFQVAKDFNLRMDQTLYMGDDERDYIAAANAGCGMIYLTEKNSFPKLDEFPNPIFISKTLQDSIDHIVNSYSK